jgi:AraC-like DNA-binding protein
VSSSFTRVRGLAEFATDDPSEAEAHLRAALPGARLDLRAEPGSFSFRLARLDAGDGVAAHLADLRGTVLYQCGPLACVLAARPHRGLVTIPGGTVGPGQVSLYCQPGDDYDLRTTDVRQEAMFVPLAALAAAAAAPGERLPPLVFASLAPAGDGSAARWTAAARYVTATLRAHPEAMARPLPAAAATHLLAVTLLDCFPSSWDGGHPADRLDATPGALRRARSFIDANADLPLTLADIAAAARVTVRAVQLAFRRNLDMTPTAYLRAVRLEAARADLAAGGPGVTVAGVAARWGYASPRRFAVRYAERFGELPSATLGRTGTAG